VSYYAPYQAPEPPPPPPPPPGAKGRDLLSALVVAVAVAAGGVVLGLAWYLVAPPLPLRKVEGGLAFVSPQPEQLAAQDGWFTILGFVFGVLAAIAVWALVRRHRGPLQLLALLIGAIGAGFLAWQVGIHIDQDEYSQAVAAAPLGTQVERPIELSSSTTKACLQKRCITARGGDILVPALGGVIAYAVLAGWSRWPSLRRQEDEHERLVQGGGWPELGEVRRDGPYFPQQ